MECFRESRTAVQPTNINYLRESRFSQGCKYARFGDLGVPGMLKMEMDALHLAMHVYMTRWLSFDCRLWNKPVGNHDRHFHSSDLVMFR